MDSQATSQGSVGKREGKQEQECIGAGCTPCPGPKVNSVLPLITLMVNNVPVRALVDTGCEQSVILESFCGSIGLRPGGPARIASMLNGQRTTCGGTVSVRVGVGGGKLSMLQAWLHHGWCEMLR